MIAFSIGLLFSLVIILIGVYVSNKTGGILYLGKGVSIFDYSYILIDFVLVGLISNLIVSYTEEILFRFFLIEYIDLHIKNKYLPVIISSLIFAIGHVQYSNIINTFIAFVGALVMGNLYRLTRSIYPGLGIHFGYNLYNYCFTSASNNKVGFAYRPFIWSYPEDITFTIDTFILLSFILMFVIVMAYAKKISRYNTKADSLK